MVRHSDWDGLVAPGETVRISATLSWENFLLLSFIEGDRLVTNNLGSAAGNVFAHQGASIAPNSTINPGQASGASIVGVAIHSGNPGLIFGPPYPAPWASGTLYFLEYDWTAPRQPGLVEFNWQGSTSALHPTFFTPIGFITLPTTYTSTSLTVVPAPATVVAPGILGAGLGVRRRRRSKMQQTRPTPAPPPSPGTSPPGTAPRDPPRPPRPSAARSGPPGFPVRPPGPTPLPAGASPGPR